MRRAIGENAMNDPPPPPFTGKHDDELRLFQRCRVNADVKAVQNALKRDGRKQAENMLPGIAAYLREHYDAA
jgi:rhodanese-related sulfurtransferase